MQTFFGWVLNAGSLLGLAVAGFAVWDRWARWRPVAHITPMNSPAGSVSLRILNAAPVDIIVLDVICRPRLYVVARGDKARDLGHAVIKTPLQAVLRAQTETIYPIAKVGDWPADSDRYVRFSIYWRKASFTWLPQMPVTVRTSTADIRKVCGE